MEVRRLVRRSLQKSKKEVLMAWPRVVVVKKERQEVAGCVLEIESKGFRDGLNMEN